MAKKLICSPFAGAGASFYKSWQKYFSELDVIAIQLPGREQLIDEKPYDSVDSAVSEIIKGLINEISKEDDIYFWGHCFFISYPKLCNFLAISKDNIPPKKQCPQK